MSSAAADLELVVLIGEELRAFDLSNREQVALGRDETNQVRLDHPSVSRRHALLRVGPPIVIEDLGGPNGTFVRDKSHTDGIDKTQRLRRLQGEAAELAVGESALLGAVSVAVRHRHDAMPSAAIVEDENMRTLHAQADRAAAAQINVLLLGETGVGKEVMARSLHARSARAKGPFVALNCAAFSELLLEGELFGYERGAFTGAQQARAGLFEAASGGTIFLDEVGELPFATQAKFLRVLEERAVLRIGARTPCAIDARFIAATNRNLEADVAAGRFRRDLFYRLSGFSLTIPPLRERPREIEPLATSFIVAACRQCDRPPLQLPESTLRLLLRHSWPGNVRELRNVIERGVVLCAENSFGPQYLPPSLTGSNGAPSADRSGSRAPPSVLPALTSAEVDRTLYLGQLDALERERISEALQRSAGNQTQAAKLLGVSRRTLVSRLAELDLPRPRKRRVDDS